MVAGASLGHGACVPDRLENVRCILAVFCCMHFPKVTKKHIPDSNKEKTLSWKTSELQQEMHSG